MTRLRLAVPPALFMLLNGCLITVPSAPGAEKVNMTHSESEVAACTPLGDVVGLTDTNYVADERREMQNQTIDLGGDTLLLTKDKDPPKGTAYRCKPGRDADAKH
jgi:hypothetical protein